MYAPNSQEEMEREELDRSAAVIEDLMRHNKYDDAMMRWLQSNGQEEELFRRVLVNHPPEVISHLQPLVLLSVGTTVTQELDGPLLVQKLAWMEMVILNLYQVRGQLVSVYAFFFEHYSWHLANLSRTTKHGKLRRACWRTSVRASSRCRCALPRCR